QDVFGVAKEIRTAGGEAVAVIFDASKEPDCKRVVDTALESFGGLHVAFNNHGVTWFGNYATAVEEDITATLDINLKSHVFCFKYQVRVVHAGKGILGLCEGCLSLVAIFAAVVDVLQVTLG
ncbi:unnamed protein product, partial [Ascophyllum nodosum]